MNNYARGALAGLVLSVIVGQGAASYSARKVRRLADRAMDELHAAETVRQAERITRDAARRQGGAS